MESFETEHVVKEPHELLPGSGVNLDIYNVSDYPTGDGIHFVFIIWIVKQKGIKQFLYMAHAIKNAVSENSIPHLWELHLGI